MKQLKGVVSSFSFIILTGSLALVGCSASEPNVATKDLVRGGNRYTIPIECCDPSETFQCSGLVEGGKPLANGTCPQSADGAFPRSVSFEIGSDGCLYLKTEPDPAGGRCGAPAPAVDASAPMPDGG